MQHLLIVNLGQVSICWTELPDFWALDWAHCAVTVERCLPGSVIATLDLNGCWQCCWGRNASLTAALNPGVVLERLSITSSSWWNTENTHLCFPVWLSLTVLSVCFCVVSELSFYKIFKLREENHPPDFKRLMYGVFVLALATEWLPETFLNSWFHCCRQVSNFIKTVFFPYS